MADGRHFEIVKSPYLSEKLSDFDEIRYTTAKLNPTAVTWPKIEIFKIQDGGRPPFLKSLNRHYLSEQSSDFNEIWYTTSDIEPDYGHVTKNWFSKFEMATAAILKIVFWP